MNSKLGFAALLIILNGIISDGLSANEILYAAVSNGRLEKYDTSGVSQGGFPVSNPLQIVVDASLNTYVIQIGQMWVRRYSPNGTPLGIFATATEDPSDPESPIALGMAFDSTGKFYLGV